MGCAIINDDKNNIVITRFLNLFIMLIQRFIIAILQSSNPKCL